MVSPLMKQAASTRRLPCLARLAPFQKICKTAGGYGPALRRAVDNERRDGVCCARRRSDQGLQAPDHCLALATAPARIDRGVVFGDQNHCHMGATAK